MARIRSTGFELQSATAQWDITSWSTASSISTTTFRSGAASHRSVVTTTATNYIELLSAGLEDGWYARAYVRFAAFPPTAQTTLMAFTAFTGTVDHKISIRVNTNGTLELWNHEDSTQIGSDSSALSLDTWYCIELKCDTTTLASTAAEARIDGISFASGTANLSVGVLRFYFGALITNPGSGYEVFFDDIAINDDSGSVQNSWPGEGSIVHLRPAADGDNAMGSRGGADSGSDWGQLDEVTPNDSTDYYILDANNDIIDVKVDSPATAGIGSSDTINVVAVYARFNAADTSSSVSRTMRLKSASGGTVDTGLGALSSTVSAWVFNSNVTSNTLTPRVTSYTDPTTGSPWTATGTNSLTNMQVGVQSVDAAPDLYITAVWALVEYVEATLTTSTSSTSSSISTSSTSASTSLSTSISVSTSSTSSSISTSSTSSSLSTSSTSSSRSTSTSSTSTSRSTSTSSTSTSRSTSTSSTSTSLSTSTSSTSTSRSTSTSSTSTSQSTSMSTSTTISTTTSTSSTSSSTSSTSVSTSSTTTLIANDIYPIPALKQIAHTSAPTTSDSTIMDDTVVTMDSASALMGGQTTAIPAQRSTIRTFIPRGTIRIIR